MGRKRSVRWNEAVKDFIIDKMCEGLTISEISKNWPDKVPVDKVIYREATNDHDPEFKQRVDDAYFVWLMLRMDELNRISKRPASELFPECNDWRQAEATRKARVDAIKFMLSTMASKLSKRFDKTPEVKITGSLDTNTAVTVLAINYSDMQSMPNLVDINQVPKTIEYTSEDTE